MKLRIYQDSVRLRLNQKDVAEFAAAGSVGDAIDFGPGSRFSYALESSQSAGSLQASYSSDCLRIQVPAHIAQQWSYSDLVGMRSDGVSPSLLIEKDFCCLHREPGEEDDPASYPNPLAAELQQEDASNSQKGLFMSTVETAAQRPPLPPFTRETAIQKVRIAEDGWNSRNPEKVSLSYSPDSWWRNRAEFIQGRTPIVEFLSRKWKKELDYRLIKELWAFDGNRIAVRFAYEWHDDSGNWYRSYGNENWEFDENGLNCRRHASINDVPIKESDRKFHWPQGRRPDDHPGLSDLGL